MRIPKDDSTRLEEARILWAMKIDYAAPAALSEEALEVAVVIDVLRATSTATVLCHRGAQEIAAVATLADLERLPTPTSGRPYLVFSELKDVPRRYERLDNSPTLAEAAPLLGKVPVLVTTNGTRALTAAARHASEVLLASFLNLEAVVGYLSRRKPERVTLLPAGRFDRNEPRAEDDACARFLGARLAGERPLFAAAEQAVRSDERVMRRVVAEPQLALDLERCLQLDGAPCVPRFIAVSDGQGHIVAAR
jgi:phosphosulfolactate phosphohydrolase-like enzyme